MYSILATKNVEPCSVDSTVLTKNKMNIPLPADFLAGFQKGKLPKSNMEVFMEKTRKPKQQEIQIPTSDKVTNIDNYIAPGTLVTPPPHIAKVHQKMIDYIKQRMFQKGIDLRLWKVEYEHTHQGTHIESKLKMAKLGIITPYEKTTMDLLLKELDSVPPEVFQRIMGIE